MTADDDRPDPEALLRRVQADERRASRAKLKIFFGFAPGVGKTFAMLEAARRLVQRGIDVVVGAVETHGRTDTAALVDGLEVLPRKALAYRGRELEEFDLDAALARKPAILLLDELAHTNAPGSRHSKRWQDVIELLDAGIEVHSTLNVQHVESLNDVVAQITHVQVRETVPDAVLERADELELVDISPEELLKRLQAGKVYLGDQAARATKHFFQRGNLLALRELALRRTAERVDADVLAYRLEHGVETTWPAGERILVMVGPAPASARLARAARRMAAGLRAPWVAAYVEAPAMSPFTEADRARLESNLKLAESLGATVVRLTGAHVSEAVLAYARKHNVTKIILGKPTHSRLRDFVRGSLLYEVVRGSGDIDVHVISGLEAGNGDARPRTPTARKPASLRGYAWAALSIALTTVLALAIDRVVDIPDFEMLFLLAVMISSRFGRGPSILAAALAVAAYDFFFVAPHFTFAIADTHYALTFGMMFGVGLVLSTLTLRVRRQEIEARAREEQTRTLYALSRDLAVARELPDIAELAARHAADVFQAKALVLMPNAQRALGTVGSSPSGLTLEASDVSVAKWSLEHGKPAGAGTETLPGAGVLCLPLMATAAPAAILALVPGEHGELTAEERGFLETFGRQIALALERASLAEQARKSAVMAKAEELRSSLLASVSHDLRTPLAAITGAATTMRDETDLPEATRSDLLHSICDEAERLERLVSNLLDMTRLESGTVRLRREWVPVEEPIGSALVRLEKKLGTRRVTTKLADDLPMIFVDPMLIEQLFFNLLENAAKYTPEGSSIDIDARAEPDRVVIEIADRGPGIREGDEERIFERFYRGDHAKVSGVGLGLPICRAIATVHDATLTAGNRTGGGAVFTLSLPRDEQPPSVPSPVDAQEGGMS
ncbi:MAG: sensor histidine kinase KdpD [Polyangiaceae bacterium]|nr:sensor histidine kinase KdpD [Polyangiaceae bacterium]